MTDIWADSSRERVRAGARTAAPARERPLRVLVLSQHYWPEVAALAQILADLCEDLAQQGHEVTVVCGQPSYHGNTATLAASEVHRAVKIRRVWSYTPSEHTIPKRLLHYASYFASSVGALLTRDKFDVCLVVSTPPLLLGISGSVGRFLRGVPFVYCVQDLYPDVAVHLGAIAPRSLPARAIELTARACYEAAGALITLSPGMATRLLRKGVKSERVHVIPNWADTEAVQPTARDNGFAREHTLTDQFVVQYSGNLGMSQGLENIVAAAELLSDLPITFLLVGDGNARRSLEADAHARGLKNVRFLPPQPRDRLSELLGACDLGLVAMKRGVGNDLVPSKLYGIMAAGRPVLAAVEAHSEVARAVSEHDCGWVVEPESSEALASAIRAAFAAEAPELARLGRNGRVACERSYSRDGSTRRYEAVLRSVANRASAR